MNFESGAYAVVTQTLSAFEHHQMAKITGTEGAIWASWSGAQDRTLHPAFALKAFNAQSGEVLDLTPDRITGEVFELQDQMAMMVNANAPCVCKTNQGQRKAASTDGITGLKTGTVTSSCKT